MSILLYGVCLQLLNKILQLFGIVFGLSRHLSPFLALILNLLNPRLVQFCCLPRCGDELRHCLHKLNFVRQNTHVYTTKRTRLKKKKKKKRKEFTHLKKVMNTRVLKVLQRHVIACCHVLVRYSHPKPLLSQILILKKVLRNSSRRLRRSRRFCHGWDLHRRRILGVQIGVQNLDRGFTDRKNMRSGLSPPKFR